LKAHEWLIRGNRERDPINAFSNFWRGFNNLYFDVDLPYEREKIRTFITRIVTEMEAKRLLNHYSSEVAYLISQPVIDMRGTGKDTRQNIQAYNAENDSLIKVQEIFMIIYQVRCNLEHGQKSPSNERDIKLCENAAPLVAAIININK